jgi:hypothetical protein
VQGYTPSPIVVRISAQVLYGIDKAGDAGAWKAIDWQGASQQALKGGKGGKPPA